MAGARELGEVHSYPLASGETFDDSGYVLEAAQGGTNEVQTASSGNTTPLIGTNYKSTENQDEEVVYPSTGTIGVVTEGVRELRGDAEEYQLGADVYVSTANDGHVNASNDTNRRVGAVFEYVDNSGGSDGDPVLVKYNFD